MNTKPLSEWTLGEIKAECVKRNSFCEAHGACPFFVSRSEKLHCKIMNDVGKVHPKIWDLSEPPRWTEQDKEDAKVIRHVISCRGLKYGRFAVTGKLYVMWDGSNNVCDIDAITDIGLNPDLLPSLKPGEVATLDEIIGGGE